MTKQHDDTPQLWIFGAGHVGTELASVAAESGFDVAVVDSRAEWADPARFPDSVVVHDADPVDFIRAGHIASNDWVVVMTHSHPLDEDIIRCLMPMSLSFLGLIGSRGKWARFVQRLRAREIPDDQIDQVYCPVGLDIGAQTPAEIALSITAQCIQVRRGGPKWSDRDPART